MSSTISSLLPVLVALLILVLLQQLGHVQARLGADSSKPTKKTPPVWPPQLTARKSYHSLVVVGAGGMAACSSFSPSLPTPRDPKIKSAASGSSPALAFIFYPRQVFVST